MLSCNDESKVSTFSDVSSLSELYYYEKSCANLLRRSLSIISACILFSSRSALIFLSQIESWFYRSSSTSFFASSRNYNLRSSIFLCNLFLKSFSFLTFLVLLNMYYAILPPTVVFYLFFLSSAIWNNKSRSSITKIFDLQYGYTELCIKV